MIRIICTECKNAYLRNKGNELVCPSCEATFKEDCENLLLGVQYYNEKNYGEADNYLMKHIVKNGAEPLAIIYKAVCDAQSFDEDTVSLEDTYKRILDSFADASPEDFPRLIALSNDLTQEVEKALVESHVKLFADADAEKIKKEVGVILGIQKGAESFREKLNELVAEFNEHASVKISAKFSDCFYVEKEIAEETGNLKFQKICDNIASHTVFTGILTSNIKNLEIYYRCIVMFFRKSHDKYEFLLSQAEKFNQLADLLRQGQYNTVKGVESIADRLKSVSYEFLQESYKEHFDENISVQEETVVILEPQTPEEPQASVEEGSDCTASSLTEETVEEKSEISSVESLDEDNVLSADETAEASVQEDELFEDTHEEAEDTSEETECLEKSEADVEISSSDDTDVAEIPEENSVSDENESEKEQSESISPAERDDSATTPEKTVADEENAVSDGEECPEELTAPEVTEKSETAENIEQALQYQTVECDLPELDENEVAAESVTENTGNVKKPKKKNRKGWVVFILVIVAAVIFVGFKYAPKLINNYKYDKALSLAQSNDYDEAIAIFKELGDYSDSKDKLNECEYNKALTLEANEKFAEAKLIFEALENYGDSKTRAQACTYSQAKAELENENFNTAAKLFTELGDYGDSREMIEECSYREALGLIEAKDYEGAIEILTEIKKYSDAKEKISEAKYMYVTDNFDKKNKTTVKYLNELTTAGYRNSAELRKELLGSSEVNSTADVTVFVNYSSTDLETSLTTLDNSKAVYFHTVVNDKSLYGKTLTLKYTTAFGYTQRETVTFTESKNTAYMSYPSTRYTNYTVQFELCDSNGKTIAQQKISF